MKTRVIHLCFPNALIQWMVAVPGFVRAMNGKGLAIPEEMESDPYGVGLD